MTIQCAAGLLEEFNKHLSLSFVCPSDLMRAVESAIQYAGPLGLRSHSERKQELFSLVNSRLKLNRDRQKAFVDRAAKLGRYFNYREKEELARLFDSNDRATFCAWSQYKGIDNSLLIAFDPISAADTVAGLHAFLAAGKVNRSDARQSTLEEKQTLIQRALFGAFAFAAYDLKIMHRFLNEDARQEYHPNFFDHLRAHHAEQLHRECAMIYCEVNLAALNLLSFEDLSDLVLTGIRDSYDRLANHCYFAIRLRDNGEHAQRKWRLFSDIILFAEKHREVCPQAGYFHSAVIREKTKEHLGDALNEQDAKFEIANEGFFFKDCYVLSPDKEEGTTDSTYDLLLLFEKNVRDQTPVPCPACRSMTVSGNSYSALGVRSWECRNPICPERSAYDRGNRYSLCSIMRQEAIESEVDQIPKKILRRWCQDVVYGAADEEVVDMLIRHFSLHRDTVVLIGAVAPEASYLGRQVRSERFGSWQTEKGIRKKFFGGAFFKRFALERPAGAVPGPDVQETLELGIRIICGDCESGLNAMNEDLFDGAVTSPPYYNAREYSRWPNIYCYLYDMYNAARAVFRTLRPGSLYIYNIFDYFDNENNIVFSAMGKKRMILGAYIIYLFERCGFEIEGNVVWFKGNIEGKRNFNQGNASPYYQLPFNCWEHCLIFRKPGEGGALPSTQILKQRPVVKMVRGENRHGHTAPFPMEIPEVLINVLFPGAEILDPYGGSMTTLCAAMKHGLKATAFEMNPAYFELGRRKVRSRMQEEMDLFRFAGEKKGAGSRKSDNRASRSRQLEKGASSA